MRRLIAVALLGLGCASPGMPPGGPPDAAAPEIVSITPDSGKVGVKPKEVLFRFDEVVSERPPGTTTLGDLFLISPRDGVPQASWHREVIGIRPAHGWRNNTPYTVIMMRGLADLRGNVRNTGASTFFSTGSTIPQTRITGSVFDWVAGAPAKGAIVESFVPPDTLHPYVALVDSNGLFAIEHVPPARYVLRAYIDRNKNLSVDPSEAWDSVGITLTDSVKSTLLIFVHDTVPPRLRELRYIDSVTIQAAFDRPIDPAQTLGVANFAVTGPDSSAVPIASVTPPVADTTGTRPSAPAPAPARAQGAARAAAARQDTTAAVPKPVMPKPSPLSEAVIKLQRALTPKAAYRVRAIGIRGLLGKVGDSERTLTVPAPAPPTTPGASPKGAASSTPSALR
ncbi:MAG TPA: Ig-like domain-containing protein [Gemmatimonadaceae bacterium]|nr:Ig-like domain-containing protein [Gemmatimonadaceae bacterium]